MKDPAIHMLEVGDRRSYGVFWNKTCPRNWEFFVVKHNLSDDENADTLLESSTALGELSSALKERLQRSVEEMRARNKEVPAPLLDIIERL
jgi:hypothetical protein